MVLLLLLRRLTAAVLFRRWAEEDPSDSSTREVQYMCGTLICTITLRAYTFTAGQSEKKKGRIESWLVLYMAPYSEWTGCGSGITKNCEWLTPKKERQQILTGRNSASTAKRRRRKFTATKNNRIGIVAIKTMLYGHRHMSEAMRKSPKREREQYQAATTTHRYMPQKTIRRKCALLVARPLRAPNRRVRTEAKL